MQLNDLFESDWVLEARVIGGVIGGEGKAFKDFDLRVEDFSEPAFALIFEKCQELFDRTQGFDVFSVEMLLPKESNVRNELWLAFELGGLHAGLVPNWLPFLYKRASERLMLQVAALMQSGEDVQEKMSQAKELFDRVSRSEFVLPDLRYDLQLTLNDIINPKRTIKTCFPRLDEIIVGLRGGRLYCIGARPGVGKTLVGMQLAWELSKQHGVVFASWEMSKEELLKRVFAQELSIDMSSIENSVLTVEQKLEIQGLIARADEQLLITDDARMTISGLRSFILNARKTRRVDVVFVDYLQIVNIEGKFQSKREKVDQITIELKRIAREFDVAVVALGQLNRGAKEDEAPNVADFKESGQVEQEADVVLLLHRKESQYEKDQNFDLLSKGLKPVKSLMVFDVAKNRFGAVGGFVMTVFGRFSRLGIA